MNLIEYKVPITFLTEDMQQSTLDQFNVSKKRQEQIPLVPRNLDTGWPMLQVSLFSAVQASDHSIKYENMLGGGKCHAFITGAFNLAHLISKISGPMDITHSSNEKAERNQLNANNINLFLDGFSIHHKLSGLKISSKSSGYGKTLEVQIPQGDSSNLIMALLKTFNFAVKPQSGVSDFSGWQDSSTYTEEDIQNAITEFATFQNGQIFIDFGAFLEQQVKDKEIIEYFKIMFKVDEFQNLKKSIPEFQMQAQKPEAETDKHKEFELKQQERRELELEKKDTGAK